LPRSSSKQGPVRKPKADIFTALLALALVALIAACVFLYFDIARYEASVAPVQPAPSPMKTMLAAATPINPSDTGHTSQTGAQTPIAHIS
jgi:hypothetical protein